MSDGTPSRRDAGERFLIRAMTLDEVELAAEWARQEGWNPGLHDAPLFYAADPGGFLIGVLDGEPVVTISMVRYGDAFAFGGFYIAREPYRHLGYGIELTLAALELAGNRCIGGDGVVEQQENYKKIGFKLAHRNVRYAGRGGGSVPAGAIPVDQVDFAELCAFDRRYFPAPREVFLKHWLRQPEGCGYAVREDGALAGYGVVRKCHEGYKIGPLFAESPQTAGTLFEALAAEAGDAPLFLDLPMPNREALELAQRNGMSPVFETGRMYRGNDPELPLDTIYGITSFELG